jgi:hypothetical protein
MLTGYQKCQVRRPYFSYSYPKWGLKSPNASPRTLFFDKTPPRPFAAPHSRRSQAERQSLSEARLPPRTKLPRRDHAHPRRQGRDSAPSSPCPKQVGSRRPFFGQTPYTPGLDPDVSRNTTRRIVTGTTPSAQRTFPMRLISLMTICSPRELSRAIDVGDVKLALVVARTTSLCPLPCLVANGDHLASGSDQRRKFTLACCVPFYQARFLRAFMLPP